MKNKTVLAVSSYIYRRFLNCMGNLALNGKIAVIDGFKESVLSIF